jgi:hypothetical protein
VRTFDISLAASSLVRSTTLRWNAPSMSRPAKSRCGAHGRARHTPSGLLLHMDKAHAMVMALSSADASYTA